MSITAFKYLTPNGNEVHEIGITPDISVLVPRGETKDVQLEAAVTRLQGELLNNH
jgi:C-terminal processing protease CtpA/Prc